MNEYLVRWSIAKLPKPNVLINLLKLLPDNTRLGIEYAIHIFVKQPFNFDFEGLRAKNILLRLESTNLPAEPVVESFAG